MATRDEVHRLVDVLPEDRVAAIVEVLRAAIEAGLNDDQAHRLAERLNITTVVTLDRRDFGIVTATSGSLDWTAVVPYR